LKHKRKFDVIISKWLYSFIFKV